MTAAFGFQPQCWPIKAPAAKPPSTVPLKDNAPAKAGLLDRSGTGSFSDGTGRVLEPTRGGATHRA